MDRRRFLVRTGLALGAAGVSWRAAEEWVAEAKPLGPRSSWSSIRGEFLLDPALLHFGMLYLTSHPTAVRDAIKTHRGGLDRNPVRYIQENSSQG